MAKYTDGYAVVVDHGDPPNGLPVRYAHVKFPGVGKELTATDVNITDDIHSALIFKTSNANHRAALALVDQLYPNAVPVRVRVTRIIDVIVEIPNEDQTSNRPGQRARIQLPRTRKQ